MGQLFIQKYGMHIVFETVDGKIFATYHVNSESSKTHNEVEKIVSSIFLFFIILSILYFCYRMRKKREKKEKNMFEKIIK